jgi:hypothetical protein
MWGIVLGAAGLAVNILAIVYFAGKLTQRVDDNAIRTAENSRRLDGHSERLGLLDVSVARLEAWNTGYEAAAKTNAGAARP